MEPALIAGTAVGVTAVVCLAVWKRARTLFTPGRIVVFAIAGALGWLVMMRAYALTTSGASDAIHRLAVAGVLTSWFVLVRDAVRSVNERDD